MDVTVVGSCMTDLVSYAPRQPKPGETIHGTKFQIGFGGKGANQCVMAAKLGAKTAMVAKVGDDSFGKNYIQNFKDNNIDIGHVGVTADASTGVAPITVSDDGQNSIVIVAGANMLLSDRDVAAAEHLIMTSKVILCQLEIPVQSTLTALHIARKRGVKSIFNPAPAQESLPTELYSDCDIFCANETEAEILTGQKVSSIEEAKAAVLALLDKGCNSVVLTLGELGSLYVSQSERDPHVVPCPKVTPVDTTGAGDAFLGALAFYLALYPNMTIIEALTRSSRLAAISVQAMGTQTSFPSRKELPSELFQ
ncbi:ribokinase-like isoform X1 [Haliotis rufescens]|uniref:ribokinase-like isoform X1 n=1 Tax=Haliotis rufescens TaxID=6454 RepID=UPI00201F5BCD|nr:ribokinase-like isoform X1 [Haliotis rufescens]